LGIEFDEKMKNVVGKKKKVAGEEEKREEIEFFNGLNGF
jgi:hypothetical protein